MEGNGFLTESWIAVLMPRTSPRLISRSDFVESPPPPPFPIAPLPPSLQPYEALIFNYNNRCPLYSAFQARVDVLCVNVEIVSAGGVRVCVPYRERERERLETEDWGSVFVACRQRVGREKQKKKKKREERKLFKKREKKTHRKTYLGSNPTLFLFRVHYKSRSLNRSKVISGSCLGFQSSISFSERKKNE